jgi:hypothetical protein
MRLDALLANAKDIASMIAQHLDAASLCRLSMTSKDSQKSLDQSEVLFACVLRTFPGIRGVPKGRESKYYWYAFRLYYSKNPGFPGIIMPHFQLVTLIGISIKFDERDSSDEDDSDQEKVRMGVKVSDLLESIQSQLYTLVGRRNIMKCVSDWKAVVAVGGDSFSYRHDAEKLLDRISNTAKNIFRWNDAQVVGYVGLYED